MDIVYVSLQKNSVGSSQESSRASQKEDQSLLRFALGLCRKHGLINERVTLLSPSDFLQMVQLCQAQVHKKIGQAFQAEDSAVFSVAQAVCVEKVRAAIKDACGQLQKTTNKTDIPENSESPDKSADKTPSKAGQCVLDDASQSEMEVFIRKVLFEYNELMSGSNHIDSVDVLRGFLLELLNSGSELCADLASMEMELVGSPQDPLQELIVEKLQVFSSITNTSTTTSTGKDTEKKTGEFIDQCVLACDIESSQVKSFCLSGDIQADKNVGDSPARVGLSVEDTSKELLQELFHSYLNLLVNTRSELAFAHVFNAPDRGLTHQAFTLLKHQARKKTMSLYQTAMSVVLQLRLGGRGYAPDPSSGLMEYMKGLGQLADLMNKMQQLLEDTECIRISMLRVVGLIKRNLVSCKSQRYKPDFVEAVAGDIQKELEQVLVELELNSTLISPDKPASQGGSLTSRRSRKVLLHYLDRCAATLWGSTEAAHHTWLSDVPFGPHTPSRFPCVLSQFRSPAVISMTPAKDKAEKKETEQKKRKLTVSTNLVPDETEESLLQRATKRFCDTVIVLPSKTIVHPAESRALQDLQPQTANSMTDKENLNQPAASPTRAKGKKAKASGKQRASLTSVPVNTAVRDSGQKNRDSSQPRISQPSKPVSKQEKKCRRRLIPPVQGQKPITSFFRV